MGVNFNSEFRYLLKVHSDVSTVPEVIRKLSGVMRSWISARYHAAMLLSYYLADTNIDLSMNEQGMLFSEHETVTKSHYVQSYLWE